MLHYILCTVTLQTSLNYLIQRSILVLFLLFLKPLSLRDDKLYIHNYKQTKTDSLRWLNFQIANYKQPSGHNFHGSHCNNHFQFSAIKKTIKESIKW